MNTTYSTRKTSNDITIDPITRIEGHLRIDAVVAGGQVGEAWASCSMWRGIEPILLGRDPREAWFFTQRFCGVCTTVHAMASVRAVEDALALEVPLNAQLIRNLILIAPPLVIEEKELLDAISLLDRLIGEMEAGLTQRFAKSSIRPGSASVQAES